MIYVTTPMFIFVENSLHYMAEIQAVVFDLYGTLIYLADETKPYARLFTEMGLQTSEEFRQARRIALTEDFANLTDLVKRIKPNTEIDLLQYEKEIKEERASALLYPETRSVLDNLRKKDLRLGLISNLASPYKLPFFELGLNEYFDEVVFSCDVGLRKPDLGIYQKIVEKLGIDHSKALMIGDKVHADVDGPKSIGMNAVHIDRRGTSPNSISTLEGVFQYL